jgi:hypothetical protein
MGPTSDDVLPRIIARFSKLTVRFRCVNGIGSKLLPIGGTCEQQNQALKNFGTLKIVS